MLCRTSSKSAGPTTAASRTARIAAASTFTDSGAVRSGAAKNAAGNSAQRAERSSASRKLPHRDYLLAVAIFANGAKGHSALQLGRDLNCQYKTAFVLAHKLREAMGSEVHNPDQPELSGTVEIDGM